MAQLSKIAQLEERRRRLVAESESCRQQIARELEALRPAAIWAQKGYSMAHSLHSLWPIVSLAGGVLAARQGGFLLRTLGRGWSVWQLGKRLSPLWKPVFGLFRKKEIGGDGPS